jgi:signal transduction histidine kinase
MISFKKRSSFKLSSRNQLEEFNKSLKLIGDIEVLKDYIAAKLKQISNVKSIYIFLLNYELNRFFINGNPQQRRDLYFTLNDNLIFWLRVNNKILDLQKLPYVKTFFTTREYEVLDKLETRFVFPLQVMNSIKGMVFMTDKTNNASFSKEELSLLRDIIDQGSFAIENVLLNQIQVDRLKRMYHSERMSNIGQLAAGAAHEIRNPLTSIRSTIQFLMRNISIPEEKKLVNNLLNEVDRINDIIQGLLSFSKPEDSRTETVDIDHILRETVQLISKTADRKDIQINYTISTFKVKINANSKQLKQVFLNILINAIQAIEKCGKISISIEDDKCSKINSIVPPIKEEIYIIIADNGKGIAPENIEKVFDPFYTNKSEGTGLGLSISYGIINHHGGDIIVKSKLNKGTMVIISLPYTVSNNYIS